MDDIDITLDEVAENIKNSLNSVNLLRSRRQNETAHQVSQSSQSSAQFRKDDALIHPSVYYYYRFGDVCIDIMYSTQYKLYYIQCVNYYPSFPAERYGYFRDKMHSVTESHKYQLYGNFVTLDDAIHAFHDFVINFLEPDTFIF